MTTLLIILGVVALFGLMVWLFIDREALGWRPTIPAGAPDRGAAARAPRAAPQATEEAWRGTDTGATVLFFLLALIMLASAAWFGAGTLRRVQAISFAHLAPTYPTVSGEVVSTGVVRVRGGRGSTAGWRPSITYRYVVAGQVYTSTVWRANPSYLPDLSSAERVAAAYRRGATVRVRYDPIVPQRAALDSGFVSWFDYLEVGLSVSFTTVMLLFGLLALTVVGSPQVTRASNERAQGAVLRELLWAQPQPPRLVPASALIPAFYRPWLHLTIAVATGGALIVLLGPMMALPHGWVLLSLGALILGLVVGWPLARYTQTLWAIRHGVEAYALISEYYLKTGRGVSEAQVLWRVRGPAGDFEQRWTIREEGHQELREGSLVRVLVHPKRPKVLRVVAL